MYVYNEKYTYMYISHLHGQEQRILQEITAQHDLRFDELFYPQRSRPEQIKVSKVLRAASGDHSVQNR